MVFLLDTNAVSDLMREHPAMDARLARLTAQDRVVTCTIVLGEILHGIQRLPHGRRRQDLEEKAAKVLAVLPCEPVSEPVADQYATVKLARQQKGLARLDVWRSTI